MTQLQEPNTTFAAMLKLAQSPLAASIFTALDVPRAKEDGSRSVTRLREGRSRGPLDGVPIAIKANMDLCGLHTNAGSVAYNPAIAKNDAKVVEHLRNAGAVVLGHTNMSEFAFSGLGVNPHFGTPANGLAAGIPLVPGGSSSGSASAVALNIVDHALGTDTSGSVRVPAAFQGLVGFRPSMHRYSVDGIFPLAPSLDVPGPITRTVSQAVDMDHALSGSEAAVPAEISSLAFIAPSEDCFGTLDEDVSKGFEAAIAKLKAHGARVLRKDISSLNEARAAFAKHGTLASAEARETLSQYVCVEDPKIDVMIRNRLRLAADISPEDVAILRETKARLEAKVAEELGDALLLMPTTPSGPQKLIDVVRDAESFARENQRTLSLTMLGAFLNMPTLALPIDLVTRWLSLSIAGAAGRDFEVLSAGLAVERIFADRADSSKSSMQ